MKKPAWKLKPQRKPGPKKRTWTARQVDEYCNNIQRSDDVRAVIKGSMSHEAFAAKWNDK